MVMPWVVKECGRRGADGAAFEPVLRTACVTRSSSFCGFVSALPLYRCEYADCQMRKGKGGQRRICAVPTIYPDRCIEWWARGVYHRARIRATRWLCPPDLSAVIASAAKQSISSCRGGAGLLRCARNDTKGTNYSSAWRRHWRRTPGSG